MLLSRLICPGESVRSTMAGSGLKRRVGFFCEAARISG
jgi:hypothetical protein